MEVDRKWYQLINRWLDITDENFTEEIIFECALRSETRAENSIQSRDNTDIHKSKKEPSVPRKP